MTRERITMKMAAAATAAEKKRKETAKRENSGDVRRNLDGFEYDPSKASVLKKALHNTNVSLGTLLAAMKDLALLRGSEITPDGMLGGRGFIMPFKEMKGKINSAINDLSDITDTIADELTNPKWGLSPEEKKKVKREKKEIEEQVEEIEEIVPEKPGEEPMPKEEPVVEPKPEPESEISPEEIKPEDVIDSAEVESLKRYKDFIEGNVKDKVASVLSKNIMANFTKRSE
jgi:hypothetical protein